jgi:tetratricopeptide (TPR) repeat protein
MKEKLSLCLRILLPVGLILLLSPHPVVGRMVVALLEARTGFQAGRTQEGIGSLEDAVEIAPYLLALLGPAAEAALERGQPELALQLSLAASRGLPDSTFIECLVLRSMFASADLEEIRNLDVSRVAACHEGRRDLALACKSLFVQGQGGLAREILAFLLDQPEDVPEDATWLAALFLPEEADAPLRDLALRGGSERELALDLRRILSAPAVESEAARMASVGHAFSRYGKWDLAALAFAEAVALEPQNAQAHAYLGLAQDQLGLDGLEELRTAGELSPSDPSPAVFLGLHWLQAGETGKARQALEHALRLGTPTPALLDELGRVQALLGDMQSAKQSLLEATKLEPREPRHWIVLAQFSTDYEIEVSTVGIPSARNALVLSGSCPACLDLLGYGYYLTGNLPLAERFLWRAVAEDQDLARSLYHLGLLLASQGKAEAARLALSRALAMDAEGKITPLVIRTLDTITP